VDIGKARAEAVVKLAFFCGSRQKALDFLYSKRSKQIIFAAEIAILAVPQNRCFPRDGSVSKWQFAAVSTTRSK